MSTEENIKEALIKNNGEDTIQSQITAEIVADQATAAVSDLDFSEILANEASKSAHKELVKSVESSVSVSDFKAFEEIPVSVSEGEFGFVIEPKWLKEVCNIVKPAAQGNMTTVDVVRITLQSRVIRFTTANEKVFIDYVVPVHTPTTGLPTEDSKVAFCFILSKLQQIASSFPSEDPVSFKYNAKTQVLNVVSGETVLELPADSADKFIRIENNLKLDTLKEVGKINPLTLFEGLKFLATFAKKSDQEISDNVFFDGEGKTFYIHPTAFGYYASENIPHHQFQIPVDSLVCALKVLPILSEEQTQMFLTDDKIIIRDSNAIFGFTNQTVNTKAFDMLKKVENLKIPSCVLVPRAPFSNSLSKLNIAMADPNDNVLIEVTGDTSSAKMTLTVVNAAGKTSQDTVPTVRRVHNKGFSGDLAEFKYWVPLAHLNRIAKTSSTPQIKLEAEPAAKLMVIRDEDEMSGYSSAAILTLKESNSNK